MNRPPPARSAESRAIFVHDLFSRIAGRYDLLNHLLSLGVDVFWRRRLAAELEAGTARSVLDVCCGTGDSTIAVARRVAPGARVVGTDFSGPMLRLAALKTRTPRLPAAPVFVEGDGLELPFPDRRFDRVSVAFGVRNFARLDAGLAELARVLEPGGLLAILEFSRPAIPLLSRLYNLYFVHVLPRIGEWVSGDSQAYRWLRDSVLDFPEPEDLSRQIEAAGFSAVSFQRLTFGIVALHLARRSGP